MLVSGTGPEPPSRTNLRPLALMVAFVASLIWVAASDASGAAEPMAPASVQLALGPTVQADDPTIPANGGESDGLIRAVVRSFQTAAIGSEINARITHLPAREGDRFAKGDLLVAFDCRRLQAEQQAAKAVRDELAANHQSELKLLAYKSTGTFTVDQARHQLEKAQAELQLTTVRLESCRILAPFDGIVTEKLVQVHEIAEPNQPLIKIMNQGKVELVMMVPSAWLARLDDLTFPIRIDETGEVHRARVLQSTGLIDPVSQSARVIAELTDPAPNVLPGMSGTAIIDTLVESQ